MTFFLIDGPVLPYAWGSRTALSELLGRPASGGPEAELWLGTHSRGPARLLVPESGATSLLELLERWPALIGEAGAGPLGDLPFLLKVLAIAAPLSLQAHPTLEQARDGFAREEREGVPRKADVRNYRDWNHKPELLLALSPVEAVCGFREPQRVADLFVRSGLARDGSPLTSAIEHLAALGNPSSIEALLREIFALSKESVVELSGRLVSWLDAVGEESRKLLPAHQWFRQLHETYSADPGLLVLALLEHIELSPGEALYLGAGRLHAYLSGVGVEIMASSDNVIRGGLTQKHVDVAELCRVLNFSPSRPHVVQAEEVARFPGGKVESWPAPVEDFLLERVVLTGGEVTLAGPCLLLVTEGQVALHDGVRSASLGQGDQVFCGADAATTAAGRGCFYCATLPARGHQPD